MTSKNKIDLVQGEHVAIFGQNGSGKSLAGMYALHHSTVTPVVIYDTKMDDDFYAIIPDDCDVHTIRNLTDFTNYLLKPIEEICDYIIVRPTEAELDNPKLLDAYLLEHYKRLPESVCYIDEGYHFHGSSGICFVGLKSILTRGRSLGITCVICSQRPFFISTFVKSEVKHFYVFRLTVKKDLKEVIDICKFLEHDLLEQKSCQELKKYHYWYYDVVNNKGYVCKPLPDVRYEV